MKILVLVIIFLSLAVPAFADNVYSLIMEGRLKEAADSLSRLATAASRDGDVLFFQSLIEPDAHKAADLMKAALRASVAAIYQEEIYYHLACYHFVNGSSDSLTEIVNNYFTRWESGRYRKDFLRFSVMIDQMNGRYDAALKQADRYLMETLDNTDCQEGLVDKARVLKANDKHIGAQKVLKELSREKKGPGAPQALYLLTEDAIARKNTDDAVFYYNIFREAYPSAVGLDALIEKIGGISSRGSESNAAEKITGTFYSVKLGVFSEKDNARSMAKRFDKYDHKTDIQTKTISGVKYQVVYIGRFSSYDEASRFKAQLEAATGEVFQVVAR
ncbi:MAG: SPOR domain-containing protein [Candidatus Zixiibacteriota bacterium]